MVQNYETSGKTVVASLATKQPHELLLLLGSALTVLLTLALFGIEWYQGIADNRLAAETTTLVVNVILGSALWVSAAIIRKNPVNGALVAGVVSLILVAFGGQSGLIGGLIGLLGAVLAVATPYLPGSRRT
ncbi:MAG TPA: hypothetical protein VJ326_02425 [Thermoplasmata archaeon]|nr:hypothetical protein [Thermoplasmata archaeon]